MALSLKQPYRFGIAAPTSMGVRITPLNGAPVHTSNTFYMQATSAETNVINVSAALGIEGLALTCFVKDSPIAAFIKGELRRRNIEFFGPDIEPNGPWGCRHQFNIADSGYGTRAPRVYNDRAGEVGRMLDASYFDFEEIFGKLGVRILHLSGLICALSEETTRFCVQVANAAKKNGTRISFDLNYRASFWKGREKRLRESFTELAGLADILVGNEEDFQLCLGIEGPEAGGSDLASKVDSFKEMIDRIKKTFPRASVYGTTLREVISVQEHMWGAITLFGDEWTVIEPRPIRILDRIGGGDGFVGGLLYGILTCRTPEKATQLGWASGALATTTLEDYATPADEKMLWSIVEGNARVQR
jgi:2-dehydro-3-deoxygluconokinase